MAVDFSEFIKNVRAQVVGEFDLTQVAEWIQRHTKVGGRELTFEGREYQEHILQSEAPTIVVKKCSQVGLTELALRRTLALMDIIDGFSVFYTLPTEGFAQKVTKARIDPIIEGSPRLQAKLSRQVDSAGVKRIGNSFLYITGTKTTNSVISFPGDLIVVDELDFSDQANVQNLQSRLTASKYRWWFYLSTPTLPNFGIDAKFQTTKRHFNHCKCHACGRWYLPDYLKHVRIPGYDGDLLAITPQMLGRIDWRDAAVHCPHCGVVANLLPENRAWVCENLADNFDGEGFQVNPFDAPTIISASDLVLWSTRFKRKVDFVNYHLGQVMEDSDSGLSAQDVQRMEDVGRQPVRGFRVFGLDMGTECHLVVGVTDGQGLLTVIEKHRLDYRHLEADLNRLISVHRPTTIVVDSQPYVETVHRLQGKIHNLYGAVYVTSKDMQPFRVIDQNEDQQRTLLDKRQVNINRNVALNILMDDIRGGRVGVVVDGEQQLFATHLQDMKRKPANASAFTGEFSGDEDEPDSYVWVKTKGNDHYHHALLYCHVASQMVHHLPTRGSVPLFIGSFPVRWE